MKNKKLVVFGATGQVGSAVTRALAPGNEVWGVARFRDPASRRDVESLGARAVAVDLAALEPGQLEDELPGDPDYVLNFAVAMRFDDDFEPEFVANAEPLAMMTSYARAARGFLHCSTTAVYQHSRAPRGESDPLGDYMRAMMPTYSIGKIAGEVVVRAAARQHRVPTTIARLNVPYSATSGLPQMHALSILRDEPVPVYPGDSNAFAPIHLTDVVRTVPALLAAASLPATIVNWGGEETVSVMEWSRCLAQLLGREVRFAESDAVMGGMVPDIARLRSLVAPLPITTVSWQDGMRQIAAASDPAAAPLAGTGPT